MTFADNAARLCGKSALLLGWHPADFWSATPQELQCVLAAMAPQDEAPPDAESIDKLREQFPDG